jgi:dCMP deaminase
MSSDAYPFIEEISRLFCTYSDGPGPANNNAQVPTWDEYFHAVAQTVALRSKDKRRVGAVIVGEGNTILSTGFNGFARGIRETPARQAEDEKLFWVTHAETNAIFNAARHGVSLVGSTLYVTLHPCSGCAQAIVQAGITRVFTYGEYWIKAEPDQANRWEIARDLFSEGHVDVDAPNIRRRDQQFWTDYKKQKNREKAEAASKSADVTDADRRPPSIPPLPPTGTE